MRRRYGRIQTARSKAKERGNTKANMYTISVMAHDTISVTPKFGERLKDQRPYCIVGKNMPVCWAVFGTGRIEPAYMCGTEDKHVVKCTSTTPD